MGIVKLIGIFNTTKDSKDRLNKKEVVPIIGDRIIILGLEQTTYEWNGNMWANINGIYLKGEKGQDGLDGKNGKDAEEVNQQVLFNKLLESLKLDTSFAKKIKGEKGDKGESIKGEKGEDAKIDINEIIGILLEKLIDNKSFVEKCRGFPGKDGYSPIKGKDYFDGKDGVGKNGEDGIDGSDGRSVVLIEDTQNIEIKQNQLGIDMNKNIYLVRNNTLLCL